MFSIWMFLQFVLKMVTVFTNTRPQSNMLFVVGFVNNVL